MKIIHIVPGLKDPTCGIAVAAKIVARRQEGAELVDSREWSEEAIGRADEVWVHSMWTPGVMRAAWRAIRLGKRLVRMPHGCMDPVKLRHHGWKKALVAPLERRLFRRAERIIATDEAEERWIKAFVGGEAKVEGVALGDGIAENRTTLGDGIAENRTRERRGAREKGALRVLYIGRLTELKGVRYLMKALPKEAKLVMIGKDEGEEGLCRRIAAERGLDVEFRGVVSEEEKEAAWRWADVLCLPTLSENFGLVVAEALERGKRVITTDGAPAWRMIDHEIHERHEKRVVYLEGFRDGDEEKRVALLEAALRGEEGH